MVRTRWSELGGGREGGDTGGAQVTQTLRTAPAIGIACVDLGPVLTAVYSTLGLVSRVACPRVAPCSVWRVRVRTPRYITALLYFYLTRAFERRLITVCKTRAMNATFWLLDFKVHAHVHAHEHVTCACACRHVHRMRKHVHVVVNICHTQPHSLRVHTATLPERPCATATTLSTWRNLKKGSLVTGAFSNGSGAAFASDGVEGPTASGSSGHSQSSGPSWQRATVG